LKRQRRASAGPFALPPQPVPRDRLASCSSCPLWQVSFASVSWMKFFLLTALPGHPKTLCLKTRCPMSAPKPAEPPSKEQARRPSIAAAWNQKSGKSQPSYLHSMLVSPCPSLTVVKGNLSQNRNPALMHFGHGLILFCQKAAYEVVACRSIAAIV
jgi:hypothetical protein